MCKPPVYNLFFCIILFRVIVGPNSSFAKTETTPSQSIGFYSNGCIDHAASLPEKGMGYQVLHLSLQRTFGHPHLIKYIQDLGKKIQNLWNPKKKNKKKTSSPQTSWVVGIDDLSLQWGGPIPGPHHSHQNGLDVDISFAPVDLQSFSAEAPPDFVSMVDLQNRQMTPFWGHKQILLLKQAVQSPWVERIFVNPIIKKALCQLKKSTDPEETWIRKIRPWYGHAAHFHVRLLCPKDSTTLCRFQPALPKGDGCGKELEHWFLPKAPPKITEVKKQKTPRPPPLACLKLWIQHQVNLPLLFGSEKKPTTLTPDEPILEEQEESETTSKTN